MLETRRTFAGSWLSPSYPTEPMTRSWSRQMILKRGSRKYRWTLIRRLFRSIWEGRIGFQSSNETSTNQLLRTNSIFFDFHILFTLGINFTVIFLKIESELSCCYGYPFQTWVALKRHFYIKGKCKGLLISALWVKERKDKRKAIEYVQISV